MRIKKGRIVAEEELPVEEIDEGEVGEVDVADTDLLLEPEDVAELVAEITGEAVEVTVNDDGNSIDFAVGEDVFTIEAEGDEEILETSRRALRGKRPVRASRNARWSGKPAARKHAPRARAGRK